VVVDQLVVGQAALVHLGLGLVALGLRALGAGLLLGDLGFLLGSVGLGGARRSGLTMLRGDALTARLELALRLALLGLGPHLRQHHEQPDEQQGHHNDQDDESGGHGSPFPWLRGMLPSRARAQTTGRQ